jgi:hypothetical protein
MKYFLIWMLFLLSIGIPAGCSRDKENATEDQQSKSPTPSSPVDDDDDDDWKGAVARAAGDAFLGARHGVVYYAFDTLTYPNEPVELIARLQSVKLLEAIEGVSIAFYLDDQLIETAKTDQTGVAKIVWTPSATGDYNIAAKIVEVPAGLSQEILEVPAAPLLVAVREKQDPLLVLDLDHTVVDSSFFRVLMGSGTPMKDSVEITNKLKQRYTLIYLTHRPDLMTYRSKSWLKKNGYPDGPLLVSELKQALGSSGEFKAARLASLKETFANIQIGIGDKLSDAQAYVENGITAYLIPHYDQDDPEDIRDMAAAIRKLQGDGRLNVVSSWRQIETGIFDGRKYSAESFADGLEKQAKKLKDND